MNPKLQIEKFSSDTTASVAVVFAVVAVAMVMAAGLVLDYVSLTRQRAELQTAADAAVVAGAREINVATSDTAQIKVVAENFARTNLGLSVQSSGSPDNSESTVKLTDATAPSMLSASSSDGGGGSSGGGTGSGEDGVTITTTVNDSASSITVTIEREWTPYFARVFSKGSSSISASATAQLVGTGKVCVIGLEENQNGTVHLKKDAVLTANNCGVFSNSTGTDSIRVDGAGMLTAGLICSAGGAGGLPSSYDPSATTDCPPMPDPLSDRPPPSYGLCDYNNFVASGASQTLLPGVYCGGLRASGNTVVTLQPGIYVIKDGPLEIQASATLEGTNVGLYLVGLLTEIRFGPNSTISLTAPEDGEMAGLLFYEDRSNPADLTHRFSSNDARLLLGTLYFPQNKLMVDANAPVADQSAYTAIIANKLILDAGPNLVLNTDYAATEIPIPNALKGVGGRIVLAK